MLQKRSVVHRRSGRKLCDSSPVPSMSLEDAVAAFETAMRGTSLRPEALALYARWWQLEAWLRDLAYLELRTFYGRRWTDQALNGAGPSKGRQASDALRIHMWTSDNENPLAYLDYSALNKVLLAHWSLVEKSLAERRYWEGVQSTLNAVRNRLAHLRRPHPDDVSRIEQLLRDLEPTAFIAISEYNERNQPSREGDHPVAAGWIRGEHPDARRLIDHAATQYDSSLLLRESHRPWGDPTAVGAESGRLWHARFLVGGLTPNPTQFWREIAQTDAQDLLVFALFDPYSVEVSFSDADDSQAIADAIGTCFDAAIASRSVFDRDTWKEGVEATRALD